MNGFARANHDCRAIALKEQSMRVLDLSQTESSHILNLAPSPADVSLNRTFDLFLKCHSINHLHDLTDNPAAMQDLKQRLTTFRAQYVGEVCISLRETFDKMIAAKTLTLSQIDEMTRDKESELVGAALSLIIKANPLHQKQNQIDFLRVAAEYGNRRVCEMLLESGEPLTEEERGQLLSIAAESRNPLLLQLLLASGPISEQAKGSALEKAAHCNHIDIVKTLLNSGTISSDCIGYVLYRSAEHDRLEIVKLILANPERISPNAWKSSSHVAAEEGRLDVVKALLASGKLTAEMKEEAFIGALDHDHFDVAQYLLNDAEIATSDNRATLVCVAADCGALEIMNEYLAQEVLADNWKALAITNAVLKGHLPIVQVLLAKGPLEPSFIQESIALADKKGHTEISLLLKDFIRANS